LLVLMNFLSTFVKKCTSHLNVDYNLPEVKLIPNTRSVEGLYLGDTWWMTVQEGTMRGIWLENVHLGFKMIRLNKLFTKTKHDNNQNERSS
jgi:hypothetical protein